MDGENDRMINANSFQVGFKLNMRIIADALERELKKVEVYFNNGFGCLQGVKFLTKRKELHKNCVYLVRNSDVDSSFVKYDGIAFVVLGYTDISSFSFSSPVIQIFDDVDFFEIFDLIQQVFDRYMEWDWALQQALNSPKPLDEMLIASMKVFRNPMFIHDANFFIMSSPVYVSGMLIWERDPKTGQPMTPMETINDFKVDEEYQAGLNEKKPILFSSNQRGYRILFINLWNHGYYEGRILVDEIQSAIQPGDFYAIEYLGKVIEMCFKKQDLFRLSMGNAMEQFGVDLLNGQIYDEQQLVSYLHFLSWNRYDTYLCLRIITEQEKFNFISSSVTMGQINQLIPTGITFVYDNSIVVIVNLSYIHLNSAQILSKLAIVLREGLLKIGVSSELHDFMMVAMGYRQAKIALKFGRISSSTQWYYYFSEYMLDYLIDCSKKELPLQMVCVESLYKLKEYDKENNTELYHTLFVYLKLERNVLQTSKELYIHRSTLTYRIERIRNLTGVDLNDPKERLKLLISFYMIERDL